MKKLLSLICLLFLAPGAAHALGDPLLAVFTSTVPAGEFDWNDPVDMASITSSIVYVKYTNPDYLIDTAYAEGEVCAQVAGADWWNTYTGVGMVAGSTQWAMTVGYGGVCKLGTIGAGPNSFPYNGGGYSHGLFASIANLSPPQYIVAKIPTGDACLLADGSQVTGNPNCYCADDAIFDPVLGCKADDECDTNTTPPGTGFTVNIFTGTNPDVCINKCVATTGQVGISLPYSTHTSWAYTTNGATCNGSEFGPDGADYSQNPPEAPTCRTVGGHEYCFNPADNNVTIDGVPVWDFDQGDFADGTCSITGAGSIICDSNTYPGGNNSDTPPVNFAVDTDGDGQIDVIIIDETPIGLSRIQPGTRIDTNGDGSTDAVAVDTNNDGVSDKIAADNDNDGQPDQDDPSTPGDESNPDNPTPLDPTNPGSGGPDNDTGDCIDNPNTPWNECDTDGDDTGGDPGDGSCTDNVDTPWNDCNVGADLDGCSREPEVSGDPLQAAAIYLAWQSACAGYVPPEVAGDGQGLDSNRPEDDGSFLQETFDIPSVLDQTGFLGSAPGLPDYDVNILGSSYSIAFSKLDGILGIGGNLLVIISLLWGGRILLEV